MACLTSFRGSPYPVYCADAVRVCERSWKHCTCEPTPGMHSAYTTHTVDATTLPTTLGGPQGISWPSLLQVSFAVSSPLVWDKAPNSFGQKAVVVDPTGVAVEEEEDWLVTAASVASHLIRLAVAQRIIDYEDLRAVPSARCSSCLIW